MALARTNLTVGANTAVSSQATASVTPTGNRLQLLAVAGWMESGVTPNAPTVTGNGLTWVSLRDWAYDIGGTGRGRLTLFRAMVASPTTGASTIDWAAQTQSRTAWSWVEYAGADTSGTHGSGAIVQSGQGPAAADTSATSVTTTLSAFGSANNMAYSCTAILAGEAMTQGSGFTEIHEQMAGGNRTLQIQEKLNDNTVDCSWTTSVTHGMIAIEIKEAVAAAPVKSMMLLGVGS